MTVYRILCKNCQGKGHVFDSASLLVCPLFWPIALFELNNPNGVTREECVSCGGTGYRQVEGKEKAT